MQTVLGAGGQIAEELTRELHRSFTRNIRLVSRNPRQVHGTDQLVSADLTDAEATAAAEGSDIVYFTTGLPMDSGLWERQFPAMMANAITACQKHGARLVFFDNTHMYPRTSVPQTEETIFDPVGREAPVRAQIASMLLAQMDADTTTSSTPRSSQSAIAPRISASAVRTSARMGANRLHRGIVGLMCVRCFFIIIWTGATRIRVASSWVMPDQNSCIR